MKKSRFLSIGILLLSLMLILTACGGSPSTEGQPAGGNDSSDAEQKTASDKIKIMVVGPMTGDSANIGAHQLNGATLAAEEINASGGVNGAMIELEVGDDQANPNQASILAEKIIVDDEILAVLGHINTGCSLSALPIYEKVNMPVISGTNTGDTICDEGYGNYFRIIASDSLNTKQQTYLAIKELGYSKPALLWENTDYGKGMRDIAVKVLKEDFGITPVGDESYIPGVDRDYSAQITKFKGAGADVLLVLGEYTAGALIAKQNAALGLNAQIVASNGCSNPQLIEIAGEDAEGIYVMTGYDPNDPREKQQTFTKNFLDKYGEEPGEWAAHAYDIVYLIKAAYENGGTTREALIDALHNLGAFDGVTGTIEFDERGDVPNKMVSMMKVEGGKFVTYIPEKF